MKRFRNRWGIRFAAIGLGALALVAAARPAARAWERWQRERWHTQVLKAFHQLQFDDSAPEIDLAVARSSDGIEEDDPTIRRLYNEAYFGKMTPDVAAQVQRAAQREAKRWPNAFRARGVGPNAAVVGQSWINLGPTDARIQQNGAVYNGIDSGRSAEIRVDPRDKDVVYLATAWGGVWKTYNFTATQPTWLPITDTVATDVVGSFEMDPNNPDTLYLGLGDQLDNSVAGGALYKSTDGGGSWTQLNNGKILSGMYANGRTESAVAIRDIAVDGNDSTKLLVATDIGLFRSVDSGATFTLVQLPTGATALETATWTIAYLGHTGAASGWVVSGMYACGPNLPPPGFGAGQPVGAAGPPACAGGTLGDIWRSADSGASWTSLRQAGGKLPTLTAEVGRMALAAGNPANYPNTIVYAQVANIDDAASSQLAVTKSTDGGQTFTAPATSLSTAVPTNPTTGTNCQDLNVAHGQAWYNLAIAVDPTNDNNVLIGGNLCGVRTKDGGTTWQNVSNWLPPSGGATAGGTLPYVHADWHTIHISNAGGSLMVFAGSDGGIFSAPDVFSAANGEAVSWNTNINRGVATLLFYGISSGDPTIGDQDIVYGGLQDCGTRFRDLDPTLGKPTTFNQVVGGDGIGTALSRPSGLTAPVFYGSLPSQRTICADTAVNCSQGTGWGGIAQLAVTPDTEPFLMRYAVVEGATDGSVITATTKNIYKLFYNGTTRQSTKLTAAAFTPSTRNIAASPFTHTDCGAAGGQTCRLYGVALTGGNFSVGTDIAGTVTWANAPALLGIGAATNMRMSSTTSIAFPSSAAHFLAGAHDGKVFIATSSAPRLADAISPVPDSIGRIFLTTDGGATYTPFHGNGTSDLPNVPQQVVVFDPSDTTDSTIFVGNDLGVYQTTDMGKTWHRYGVGLPMVRVVQIFIAKNSGLMRVGTYGRGFWEIYPNATEVAGVRGDGDWDRNLAIDFLDLGATASRLGDTPATAAQPYYDWHLDQSGTPNTIGDEDLTALLGKFGSHP